MSLLSCAAAVALCATPAGPPAAPSTQPASAVAVAVALNRPLASFDPRTALGGALDGHSAGEVAQIYTPHNLRAMAAAGLGAVTYRLRTELGVQSWHYSATGHWSDGTTGYWTGASRPTAAERNRPPRVSWGYALPRRGDTVDQADDEGYSRLDDGDLASYWKSNPYLDSHFTHEREAAHPQWVLVDLGRPRGVDALRIAWYAPWARRIRVQYWVGRDAVLLAGNPPGHWRDFPYALFVGRGGTQTLRLARRPVRARFVRIVLMDSSHTPPSSPPRDILSLPVARAYARARTRVRDRTAPDIRDRLGYAIRELNLGTLGPHGQLHDLMRHRASDRQTVVYTSSTDPWSRASARNPGYEQPSFQTVMRSGLTRSEPLLVPVPVLYGTPAGAVAQLRYLHALGVPLRGVELGEEPDGQLIGPEDYGALYIQFARAIHAAFPTLPLGGPGFQTAIPDWVAWPNARGERSWMERFLGYLSARGALSLLSFFSFEWYPFDDICANPAGQLAKAADLLRQTLAEQRAHGLPAGIPIYITEYGYSAFAGEAEVSMPGALLDADTVGTALSEGVNAAYLYGYEPEPIMRETGECDTWGNLELLQSDAAHRVRARVAAFWETWMLTHLWTQPSDGDETVLATSTSADGYEHDGHALVRAYALRGVGGSVSVLLLNMSPRQSYDAQVSFNGGAPPSGALVGWQLSDLEYHWHTAGASGHPSLSLPPAQRRVTVDAAGDEIGLPPYSITVLRAP